MIRHRKIILLGVGILVAMPGSLSPSVAGATQAVATRTVTAHNRANLLQASVISSVYGASVRSIAVGF